MIKRIKDFFKQWQEEYSEIPLGLILLACMLFVALISGYFWLYLNNA